MGQELMVLAIIEKVIRYGPSAVLSIAEAFGKEEKPTIEEIKALKITKDPQDYFE